MIQIVDAVWLNDYFLYALAADDSINNYFAIL